MTDEHNEVDFDYLVKLNEDDPEAFEEYRQQVLEDFFNSLPEDRQLKARQEQWKLDGELRKFKNPQARLNRMIELFWDQAMELNDVLNGKYK